MSGGSLGAQEAFGGARCLVRIEESHVGGKKRESKRGAGAGVGPLAANRGGGGSFFFAVDEVFNFTKVKHV